MQLNRLLRLVDSQDVCLADKKGEMLMEMTLLVGTSLLQQIQP
jgi:hypothetical protein